LKLRWTRRALADFEQAHDHIAKDNPEAARQIAKRLLLTRQPFRSHSAALRLARDPSTR